MKKASKNWASDNQTIKKPFIFVELVWLYQAGPFRIKENDFCNLFCLKWFSFEEPDLPVVVKRLIPGFQMVNKLDHFIHKCVMTRILFCIKWLRLAEKINWSGFRMIYHWEPELYLSGI
jgi:hypothetical protein